MHRRFIVVLAGLGLCVVMSNAAATTKPPASTTPVPTTPKPSTSVPTTPVPTTPATDVGIPAPGGEDVACSTKKPCPDKNSACIDGRCLCNEGFSPAGNDTCLKVPTVGETCRKGSVELSCTGDGVESQCPPKGTVCVCKDGFDADGKGACKIILHYVGDACKIDADCKASFSSCQKGKCACIDGFKADTKGTLCTPTSYNCPDGLKALEEKGSVRLCDQELNEFSEVVGNDTCPSTHFCYSWQDSRTTERSVPGHCCPKPKVDHNITVACPVGVEHKTGKCLDQSQFPADAPLPAGVGPLCSSVEYECYLGRICCPQACRVSSSYFNVNGKCYDTAILDQPCELNSQCLPNSECKKGTCQCKAGYSKLTSTYCLADGQPNPFAG